MSPAPPVATLPMPIRYLIFSADVDVAWADAVVPGGC
jgi:hypothetical protein